MNGWLYDVVTNGPERRVLGPIRSALLGALSGEVVEVGAGTGLNFPHYPAAARVHAIEPNTSMLANARMRLQQVSAQIELIQGGDEMLDSIEGSVDAVVATLVFCSVEDPGQTMARVVRVLKPGGRFVTLEHVNADGGWGDYKRCFLRFGAACARIVTSIVTWNARFTLPDSRTFNCKSARCRHQPAVWYTGWRFANLSAHCCNPRPVSQLVALLCNAHVIGAPMY